MRWRGPTDVSEFDRYQVLYDKMMGDYDRDDGDKDTNNDNDNDNDFVAVFDQYQVLYTSYDGLDDCHDHGNMLVILPQSIIMVEFYHEYG